MKRLLAYLFMVLCLGLTFNVKVEASKLDFSFCKITNVEKDKFDVPYETEIYAYEQILGCKEGTKNYNWGTQKREKISTNEYIEFELNRMIKRYKKTQGSDYEIMMSELDMLLDRMIELFKVYKSYGLDPIEIVNVASSKEKYYVFKKSLLKHGFKLEKTAIVKADPSQTQKVAKVKENFICVEADKNSNSGVLQKYRIIPSVSPVMVTSNCLYKIYEKDFKNSFNKIDLKYSGFITSISGYELKQITNRDEIFVLSGGLIELNSNFALNKNSRIVLKQKTQIAKTEPTVKPKKKTKIVKKEPKQEEFKPKKTNQDKDPPIIEVAENITVSDSAYEIKGNVKDKSKKIFIEVDGQTIPVKKGKFKLKRFSPVDEQIKIVAIDQWGNRSKPKIVNVTIDIKNIEVAQKIEPLNPTKMRSRKNKDRIALIIGIEKYDQIPSASYANLDAKFFYEYARKGFGISKSNIKRLIDEDADLVKSLGALNKWLPGKIKPGQTELIIFFAGHGLASNDGKELYILPQDSDPDLLDRTALSRTELFKEIINLNPKSVTMFMDTCYSGISRDEKMLLASARPVRIVADEQEGIPNNFTIFSASQLDQISSGIKEAKHGIFSYYLMKGLEGNADANKDKNITNGELLAYMDENVSQKASELGRQQNPSLAGDPDKVLISYR